MKDDKTLAALYKKTAMAYEAALFADIPANAEINPPHVFSERFESGIEEIMLMLDRPRSRLSPAVKRTIAVIAALIAILLTALSVGAVRESLYRLFFIERTDGHAVIQYLSDDNKDHAAPDVQEDFRGPGYIPEGYIKTEEIFWTDYHSITYTKGVVSFEFEQTRIGSPSSINLEKAEAVTERIKSTDVLFVIDGHRLTAYWCDDSYEYDITGFISKEDAVKVIESAIK